MSIIGIIAGREMLALMNERAEWARRLRLSYECGWDSRARRIIEGELRRLDAEIIRTKDGTP